MTTPVSRTAFGNTGYMSCTILGIHAGTNIAAIKDQFGKVRDVRIDVLPGKGIVAPAPGEIWMISKLLGQWNFVAYMGAPRPVPEVTGSRADPATFAALLAALDAAGIIKDSTTV